MVPGNGVVPPAMLNAPLLATVAVPDALIAPVLVKVPVLSWRLPLFAAILPALLMLTALTVRLPSLVKWPVLATTNVGPEFTEVIDNVPCGVVTLPEALKLKVPVTLA